MNKAQNAQIQVNSHIIFTEYCHYLHDFGKKTNLTLHNKNKLIALLFEFSQTASARPINVSPFLLTRVYQCVGRY